MHEKQRGILRREKTPASRREIQFQSPLCHDISLRTLVQMPRGAKGTSEYLASRFTLSRFNFRTGLFCVPGVPSSSPR